MKKTKRASKAIMSFLIAIIMVVSSSVHIFAADLDSAYDTADLDLTYDLHEHQQEVYTEAELIEETMFTETLFELSLEDIELNMHELLQNSEFGLVEMGSGDLASVNPDLFDALFGDSIQSASGQSLSPDWLPDPDTPWPPPVLEFDYTPGLQNRIISRGFDYQAQFHIYIMDVVSGRPISIIMTNLMVDVEIVLFNRQGIARNHISSYGQVSESGVYQIGVSLMPDVTERLYVLVQGHFHTTLNPFLFFGETLLHSDHNMNMATRTNVGTHNFGNITAHPFGNPVFSPWFQVDFRNRVAPFNSFMTALLVHHNSTGNWGSMNHILAFEQFPNMSMTQMANIATVYETNIRVQNGIVVGAELLAPQRVNLRASVVWAQNSRWNPVMEMRFAYLMDNFVNMEWLIQNSNIVRL